MTAIQISMGSRLHQLNQSKCLTVLKRSPYNSVVSQNALQTKAHQNLQVHAAGKYAGVASNKVL